MTRLTSDASVDMVYAPREDGYINIKCMDFTDKKYFHLLHDLEHIPGLWGSYIRGVVQALQEDYVLKIGLNAIVSGKLPIVA